ncbi:hypothetical protein BDK51DRAFT_47543 [Blyttiomyces helicus]|uniref:Fibrous sheath-interacting protein 1 n=1 Tax=Blyttiomyces helicus TaxID=388810 RepID=A0A4P9WFN6_9FUNG|nr:hypothetical protein BDK51DRAFT_47543 [Blyttiomyces helicus]|eukprot:RKO91579.1 hypothetical protein BDK51DRAFT_47543 [Blyttiomyces helicus]
MTAYLTVLRAYSAACLCALTCLPLVPLPESPAQMARDRPPADARPARDRVSLRSGGGLTPLPDEDIPTIFLAPELPSAARTPTHLAVDDADHPMDGDLRENAETERLIEDIMRRHERWESTRNEVHTYLSKFKDPVENADQDAISEEIGGAAARSVEKETAESDVPPEDPTMIKIQQGFERIRELDALIKQKNTLARTLTQSRLTRERTDAPSSSTEDAFPSRARTATADSFSDGWADDASDRAELRSVHSLDTRTFLTEPKMASRVRIGIQALAAGGGSEASKGEDAQHSGKHLHYIDTVSDSLNSTSRPPWCEINTNYILLPQLGPEARYYAAMTEEEKDRVERILSVDDLDERSDTPSDVSESVPGTPFRPFTSMSMTGFVPDGEEYGRLVEIDRQLQLIIPEPEWETKSIVWSAPGTSGGSVSGFGSGMLTPMTPGLWSRHSDRMSVISVRDVEAVMHDTELLKSDRTITDDLALLKAIDERLETLKDEDVRPLSREDLDHLLQECRMYSADCDVRRMGWEHSSEAVM